MEGTARRGRRFWRVVRRNRLTRTEADQGKGFEPPGNRRTKESADQADSDETGVFGTDGRPPAPADQTASPLPSESELHPHHADGLIDAILRTDVDLSGYRLADAKTVVAAILDAGPTSEPLGRGTAGASPTAASPSPAPKRWEVWTVWRRPPARPPASGTQPARVRPVPTPRQRRVRRWRRRRHRSPRKSPPAEPPRPLASTACVEDTGGEPRYGLYPP